MSTQLLPDSSDDEDHPLSMRLVHIQKAKKKAPPSWPTVPCEGEALTGKAYAERAHKLRARARSIYDSQKKWILEHPAVGDREKKLLEPFTLAFDAGTTRRGVCKYPNKERTRGLIGLSARMVDGGTSAEKIARVILHEIAHACNPGMKHNAVWKRFNILIGGDGKVRCSDEEIKSVVGYRIEVYCPNNVEHVMIKRQKRPSYKWLSYRVCKKCNSRLAVRAATSAGSMFFEG